MLDPFIDLGNIRPSDNSIRKSFAIKKAKSLFEFDYSILESRMLKHFYKTYPPIEKFHQKMKSPLRDLGLHKFSESHFIKEAKQSSLDEILNIIENWHKAWIQFYTEKNIPTFGGNTYYFKSIYGSLLRAKEGKRDKKICEKSSPKLE